MDRRATVKKEKKKNPALLYIDELALEREREFRDKRIHILETANKSNTSFYKLLKCHIT